jgi:hypothetical protein
MTELKKQGKGNRPNASQALSDEDINLLYARRQLGSHSPRAIINSLWLNNTLYFGMRGVNEHRNIKWGDITCKSDNAGLEYLEFNERQTKTRTGALKICSIFI